MPIPMHVRKRLQAAVVTESSEAKRELVEYLAHSGLTPADFARRINYSAYSVKNFIDGRYYDRNKGSDLAIRAAIRDFISLHPVVLHGEAEGKLYETTNVRVVRSVFYECLDQARAGVIYGGPGSQKTFALEHLIAELNRREIAISESGRRAYYVYCRQGIRPSQLLKRVARACGSLPTGDADRLIRNLQFDFSGRRVLIVFDEAQHLSVDCLETLRELVDRLKCGLLFAGSHDLISTFKNSFDLEQLNSRLRAGEFELPGISEQEAKRIIADQMPDASERKAAKIIEKSLVRDLRKKENYISARRLFWMIEDTAAAAQQESVQ